MAESQDPRDDLRWIETELASKSMTPAARDSLLAAKERTLKAIEDMNHGLVCPDCEQGPGECECVFADEMLPLKKGEETW